jgi:hypothetical protein
MASKKKAAKAKQKLKMKDLKIAKNPRGGGTGKASSPAQGTQRHVAWV